MKQNSALFKEDKNIPSINIILLTISTIQSKIFRYTKQKENVNHNQEKPINRNRSRDDTDNRSWSQGLLSSYCTHALGFREHHDPYNKRNGRYSLKKSGISREEEYNV